MPNVISYVLMFLFIIFLLYLLVRYQRSYKYNSRLSKYTVNNSIARKLSLGDYVKLLYDNFCESIMNILKESYYFKRVIKRYERFEFIDAPLKLVATKFCISIIFGFIYLVSSIIYRNFDLMVLLLVMVIGYFVYNIYLIVLEKNRNKLIENDLLKAIIIMNNAFKSGYNITQSLIFVSKDLNGPISEEFQKISRDLGFGLDIKDVFERFYNRVKLNDVKFIASSLSLISLTGGDLIGVFLNIEKSFTNKKRIHDELSAMTSSSKLVFYILLFMPIILSFMLLLLSPGYFNPLFRDALGILLCFVALILYIIYIVIIRRILKVDL